MSRHWITGATAIAMIPFAISDPAGFFESTCDVDNEYEYEYEYEDEDEDEPSQSDKDHHLA